MYSDLFDLTGKRALVTGGSKGIGLAIAEGLASAGADVVINSRSEEELAVAREQILTGTTRRVHAVVADLYRREETVNLAQEALEVMGGIDILVNNAGTNIANPVDKITDEDWALQLELNLSAPLVLTRELVPAMKEQNGGRIINISSIFGLCTKEARGAYTATKSGLIGLTRTMAQDLAPWNINVNAIAPGPISTDLTDRLVQGELRDYFDSMILLGRWGKPSDLVGPALMLASEAGAFMTGSTITVDGGWMTR